MIDLHTHVLPALDDGPDTLAESLDMLRALVADGVDTVAATPHVRDDYPTTADAMHAGVRALQQAADDAGVGIAVLPGAEVDLGWLPLLEPAERAALGLGGNPKLLLVEFPYVGWPLALADVVFRLRSAGVVPVLAHPERNANVQQQPGWLEDVVRAGAFVQVTAASVDGRLGRASRASALELVERGLAHVLASDAHTPDVRAAGLSRAVAELGDVGRWMSEDVPRALLDGAPLPPPPAATATGRGRRRRWLGR